MNRTGTALISLLAISLLILPSCAMKSRDYVDQAQEFSVLKGKVESIENLTGVVEVYLADGIALKIKAAGGQVGLKVTEERTETMDLPPGGMLLLCKDGDYLMQPLSKSPQKAPEKPAKED